MVNINNFVYILNFAHKYVIITSRVALIRSDNADCVCQNRRFCRENIGITQVVLRHDLKNCVFPQAKRLVFFDYVIIVLQGSLKL